MCHCHRAAVASGSSPSQELGILGGSKMVTLWGFSLRLRKKECLPDVASGRPQGIVTFAPPTHLGLLVSASPSVKLSWRRGRLRQSGEACHMVT